MSLREMHEQQKQSSPREQLQELNRQSRTELENSRMVYNILVVLMLLYETMVSKKIDNRKVEKKD